MKLFLKNIGRYVFYDEADHHLVSQFSWYAVKRSHVIYAESCATKPAILFHRLIMRPKKGEVVDHIDRNGLNNRRENLRICTQRQNSFNSRKSKNNDLYKGVSVRRDTGKYRARIMVNRREITLGCFDDPIEAALAYDQAAIKYFGQYAFLNFEREAA